ncbi:hypothetical protein LTR37_004012 [Vermiconidia calcicola]|uniref:Uncharacterized protein n=1 Tax=Vermiconidia calcicola TaxID=1690605 RepID=A0ACC3NNG7_9PEZI|nr:hypothetical protein LTR37_004012 [Vermiconidia calcicola]
MSNERSDNTNRPLKPTLATNRTPRTPLTPRVATSAAPVTKSVASKPTPTVRSGPTPRAKQTNTPVNNVLSNGNVTPRSSTRSTRVESANSSPSHADDTPSGQRPKSAIGAAQGGSERTGSVRGLGINAGVQAKGRASRPNSVVSGTGSNIRSQSPLAKSPGFMKVGQPPGGDRLDSHFFHASKAPKQQESEPKKLELKKVEPKKAAAFFYADGRQEHQNGLPHGGTSPVLFAVSEQGSTGPWIRSESLPAPSKSPPMLSPALSALSSTSPFFAPSATLGANHRPSASKDHIHLSYRRGVSQIIGTRPAPIPQATASSTDDTSIDDVVERRSSQDASSPSFSQHRKSTSLSSIGSSHSQSSRRRSATTAEIERTPSLLTYETKAATVPRLARPAVGMASTDTSLQSPTFRSLPGVPLSPTKGVSEIGAEARRERKVLDLEISNSSLLAINAGLEREVRRQKMELKRFRRLSRAGRFSSTPGDWPSRPSDGLSAVGEETENDESSMFGPPSGIAELYDDMSDDDDESLISSTEPLSPSARSARDNDRLARDEKRLQVDLEKHKELLQQSQAMNQSIKRCTYSAEEMIREGKKALNYHVKLSDVKLGGRVLSSREDDEDESQEIEVEDDYQYNDSIEQAKGFLDAWTGVGRPSFESSESGDRDSGIDVDRPPLPSRATLPLDYKSGNRADSGRPPGAVGGLASLQ